MTDKTSPPSVDLQDPLPEASWLWRRVFTFVAMSVLLGFVYFGMTHLAATALQSPTAGIEALKDVIRYLLLFAWLLATYYLLAPSAEQLVKLVQVSSLLKDGVKIAGRQIVQNDGSSDTATTIGKPPAPPVPQPVAVESDPPWDKKP